MLNEQLITTPPSSASGWVNWLFLVHHTTSSHLLIIKFIFRVTNYIIPLCFIFCDWRSLLIVTYCSCKVSI